jgi:hypothetical protein
MRTDQIVQLVALAMCLALAWRGLRGQRLDGATSWKMALAWVCIVAAVALGVRLLEA